MISFVQCPGEITRGTSIETTNMYWSAGNPKSAQVNLHFIGRCGACTVTRHQGSVFWFWFFVISYGTLIWIVTKRCIETLCNAVCIACSAAVFENIKVSIWKGNWQNRTHVKTFIHIFGPWNLELNNKTQSSLLSCNCIKRWRVYRDQEYKVC